MGWSKKDYRKRRTGYVLGSLDRAMEHCFTLKADFDAVLGLDPRNDDYEADLQERALKDSHAKLAFLLHTAMSMMLMAQQFVEQFAEQAYGSVPDRVERWTKTGEDWRKAQEDEKGQ